MPPFSFFYPILSFLFLFASTPIYSEEQGFQLIENDRELSVYSFSSGESLNADIQKQDDQLGKSISDVLRDQISSLPFVIVDNKLQLFSIDSGKWPHLEDSDNMMGLSANDQPEKKRILDYGYKRYGGQDRISPVESYTHLRVRRINKVFSQEKGDGDSPLNSDYLLGGKIFRQEKGYFIQATLKYENGGMEKTFEKKCSRNVLDELQSLSNQIIAELAGTSLVEVNIATDPAGYLVYLDNFFFGETPIEQIFPRGKYQLEVRKDNDTLISQVINLDQTNEKPMSFLFTIPLQEDLSEALIDSSPSGAQVYLNEEYFGVTPLSLQLKAGKKVLRVRSNGYQDFLDEIEIEAGKKFEKKVALENSMIERPYAEDYYKAARGMLYTFLGFYAGWLYFNVQGNRLAEQERASNNPQRNSANQYSLANTSALLGILSLTVSGILFSKALNSENYYEEKSEVSLGSRWTENGFHQYYASYHLRF